MTDGLRERCLQLRDKEFPWTAVTAYFNNAGIGPLPERTLELVDKLNREKTTPHQIDDARLFGLLADTRRAVAKLINADVDEICLTTGTTLGLNIAARALPLKKDDVVLVPEREFPANVYPWLQLESRGVVVELVQPMPNGWPNEDYLCERVLDPKVRALAISLVQFSNGFKADVKRLGEACRAGGCYLVVDGMQGIGQLAFDVREMPIDMLACGGQKWLLSPFGSGFLYVRKGLLERLEPTFVGWLAFAGTDDFTRLTEYNNTLRVDARRFEINTLPFQDLAAMGESIKILCEFGVSDIEEWLRAVRRPLLEASDAGKLRVISPLDEGHTSSIVCVVPNKLSDCCQKLRQERVTVVIREGALRFSPHCYNTPDEMERAVAIMTGSA